MIESFILISYLNEQRLQRLQRLKKEKRKKSGFESRMMQKKKNRQKEMSVGTERSNNQPKPCLPRLALIRPSVRACPER